MPLLYTLHYGVRRVLVITENKCELFVKFRLFCLRKSLMYESSFYNKTTEQYAAQMRSYDSNDELKSDILSGDPPDVFLGEASEMYKYTDFGAFENIYELMDERGGLKREDILPNILSAFEYKGGVYALPTTFRLDHWLANSKIIGREHSYWTLDEFLDIAEALPDGMYLGSKNSSFTTRGSAWMCHITAEETSRFFAGECSAEQCAEMIQNRVSILLSERS